MVRDGKPSKAIGQHASKRRLRMAPTRRGFTLVEVLVVLAIMVILFGLLFAPMVTGLNLVRRGKRHVAMQDAVRLSLEQMKRELQEAAYVFDPEVIHVTSVNGTAANLEVVDYSTVSFAPAQRNDDASVLVPLRPEVVRVYDPSLGTDVVCFKAVRYCVHLVNDALSPATLEFAVPHGEDNPFAVFREEGYVREDPPGSGHWTWWSDNVLATNALTPRSGVDLPPSVSICQTCGSMWTGYAPVCLNSSCPDANTAVAMRYITEGAQFVPKRVVGELMTPSADRVLYRARWGGWLGTQNDGSQPYTTAELPLVGSELNPRIVVYRYDPSAGVQDWTLRVLDTGEAAPNPDPNLVMRWNSGAGSVRFGDWVYTGPVFSIANDPGSGFYELSVRGDSYDTSGRLVSGPGYTADLYPVYPPTPTYAGDPRAPIAYVIDPTCNGTKAPAKVVAENISVRLLVQLSAAPSYRYYELHPTANYDQDRIGRWQFCAYPSPDSRTVQVRFSRRDPPSPDWFGGAAALSAFAIEIRYYVRHNFDRVSNYDDIVLVDYSTRYTLNICLTLSAYVDLEPSPTNVDVLVVPSDVRLHRIQARDQVVIRNAMD